MSNYEKSYISASQMRSARALLNWSQEELALACNLSVATIRKLETGHISPRIETNITIKHAFEEAGLEFINPNGVRQKPEEITIYEQHEGICSFYDGVYQYASKGGRQIETVCINEDPITEALAGYTKIHTTRMASLSNKTYVKCILTENNKSMPAEYCEYRSISKAYVDSVPFYVYGNNYAMFIFGPSLYPKIIVHHSALLADAYRKQFYSMWDKATLLNGSEPHKVSVKKNHR